MTDLHQLAQEAAKTLHSALSALDIKDRDSTVRYVHSDTTFLPANVECDQVGVSKFDALLAQHVLSALTEATKERDGEIERKDETIGIYENRWLESEKRYSALSEQLKVAKEALEWYATATYPDDGSGRPLTAFQQRAKQALDALASGKKMTPQELIRPLTPVEVSDLFEAAKFLLPRRKYDLLRRLAFQADKKPGIRPGTLRWMAMELKRREKEKDAIAP